MRKSLVTSFALLAPSSQAYVWPNKYDQLDDLLYLQSGFMKDGSLSDRQYFSSPLSYVPRRLTSSQKS
jgi:hypothetical protein